MATLIAATGGASKKARQSDSEEDDKEEEALASEDLSEDSDRSDASDVFHVSELPEDEMPICTEQDLELRRFDRLATKLRARPLLPPVPGNANESYSEITSGIKLPNMHCAFAGCSWVIAQDHAVDAKVSYYHELHCHLTREHRDEFRTARSEHPRE